MSFFLRPYNAVLTAPAHLEQVAQYGAFLATWRQMPNRAMGVFREFPRSVLFRVWFR
ncbi:hypothetical protein Z949_133 [Sulfitobacter guttiformis KCTC 32187]|nr:hypothetical protein Z949_133 [Sulfitobacter guttiformis KCTC 32187]